MTAWEFTEGTTLSSSDFVEVRIKEVKKNCLAGIDQVFCCDQCFLDFGEGFCNRKHFVSLEFVKYFTPTIVFLSLVSVFVNT